MEKGSATSAALFLLADAFPKHKYFVATSGPNYPTNSSNVSVPGDDTWASPNNANAADGTQTDCGMDGTEEGFTDILKCLGYGFSLPGGSTINGITVEVHRRASGTQVSDLTIQLYKAGTLVGSNKASGTTHPTSLTTATYGGAADLWGTTWTAAQINAADFGVAFQAQYGGASNRTSFVDYIRVTIDYTAGGTTYNETGSGGSVAGTSGVVAAIYTLPASGGSVGGGHANEQHDIRAFGGGVCEGTAFVQVVLTNINGSGGAVAGGAASEEHDYSQEWNEIGTGGAVGGGTARVSSRTGLTGTGGSVAGGSAVLSGAADNEGSGGGVVGGTSSVFVAFNHTPSGGTIANGGSTKRYQAAIDALVYDSFWGDLGDDLQTHTSDTDDTWTTFPIASFVLGSAVSTGAGSFAIVDAGQDDYSVSVLLTFQEHNAGIVVRYLNPTNYWRVQLDSDGLSLRIIEVNGGVETQRGFAVVSSPSDLLEVLVKDTDIIATCGITTAHATAATYLTQTQIGLWAADVGVIFDEFLATVPIHDVPVSGGAVAGGTSTVLVELNITPSGGAVAGGEATEFSPFFNTGSGGVVAAGTALLGSRYPEVGEGGAVAGGTALVSVRYRHTASGGAVAGGTSLVSARLNPALSGGALAGGLAKVRSSSEAQLGDSLRIYLTGSESHAGAQDDETQSLGGYRSRTEALRVGFLEKRAIPNLFVLSSSHQIGSGGLLLTEQTVSYVGPDGTFGDAKEVLVGFPEVLEDNAGNWVKVLRTTSESLRGLGTLVFHEKFNTATSQTNNTEPETTYRALMFENNSLDPVTDVAVWLCGLGTESESENGLSSSGAGTLEGEFTDWPWQGWVRIDDAGAAIREIAFYESRTNDELQISGRGLLGTTAQAGVAGDRITPISPIRIAKELPVGNEIQTIADATTSPTGLGFTSGIAPHDGLQVATLNPNESFGVWIEREIGTVAAYPEYEVAISYRFTSNGTTYTDQLKGLFRVADSSLAQYEMHVGVDEEPDLMAAPDEVFASLPHTSSYDFSGDGVYHIVVNRRNAHGLVSENIRSTILRVDGGEQTGLPPSAPNTTVQALSSGAFRITATYNYLFDTLPADKFHVYFDYTGTPLDEEPVEVAVQYLGGIYFMTYDTEPESIPSTISVVVRTYRSSDEMESENSTILTATSLETEFGNATLKGFGENVAEYQG